MDETKFKQLIRENGRQNIGLNPERVNYNYREKAFSDNWQQNNRKQPGVNFGFGILQDHFFDTDNNSIIHRGKCFHKVTDQERLIVATIIQWFGSNCGFSFLQSCLHDCGYRIVEQPELKREVERGYICGHIQRQLDLGIPIEHAIKSTASAILIDKKRVCDAWENKGE